MLEYSWLLIEAAAGLSRRDGGNSKVEQSLERQILDQVEKLPVDKQREVLDFARKLARPAGRRIEDLMVFAGSIDPKDLRLMEEAIEQACEQVDANEW